MALATYSDQSPTDIRMGDVVQDAKGTYTALSNAEADQWQQVAVRAADGWHTYDPDIHRVTITFDETPDMYA